MSYLTRAGVQVSLNSKLFTKTLFFFFLERGRRGGGPFLRDACGQGSKLSYKSSVAIILWLFREPQQLVMGARSWMEPMIPYSTLALLVLGTTRSSASLSYPFLYSPWYLV